MSKLKVTFTGFMLPLILLFGSSEADSRNPATNNSHGQSGTLQKMIVDSGSVTMQLDLNGLNGSGSLVARPVTLQFAAAPNSFFPILVFNNMLRRLEPGSVELIPQNKTTLPAVLTASLNHLVIEKSGQTSRFELVVSDRRSGFVFFNVEGHQYDYDGGAQSLAIRGGRLLISEAFAKALGIPSDAGSSVGTISMGAIMQPIQIDQLFDGETKSMVMPPMQHAIGSGVQSLVPGPDVIVGEVEDVAQFDPPVGTQVGFAIGTDSCNNGDQPIDWFALPSNDHPVVPQNLYRMSGGTTNDERFEQIGQSWMKHTFLALEDFVCGSCDTSGCQTGSHLCPGCSDPYVSSLNGDQNSIGSRAWINPFTGDFPSGITANDHSGHVHNGVSHRILVETSDVMPAGNPGASYFGEAAYISPHEYTWCQSHPGECNMFNNFSYRQFSVSGGPTFFNFSTLGPTVRMQSAIQAWAATGATVQQVEPDPGNDGIFFVAYKVTPNGGLWHYEYAIFNMNVDRAIQSFSVPLGVGANISNIDFHAPPQHPGWAHDGTEGDAGYSSTPWDVTQDTSSITWSTETFAQNQNANAIRWGTLYNFRFDSVLGPNNILNATVGFFKTGSPITVGVAVPFNEEPPPTPSPTATATATASPTATATATATPSATPTSTPRPTPTPRSSPSPRVRPTPAPRP